MAYAPERVWYTWRVAASTSVTIHSCSNVATDHRVRPSVVNRMAVQPGVQPASTLATLHSHTSSTAVLSNYQTCSPTHRNLQYRILVRHCIIGFFRKQRTLSIYTKPGVSTMGFLNDTSNIGRAHQSIGRPLEAKPECPP